MSDVADRRGEGDAVRFHEPAGQRAGPGDADLLAQDGSHQQLSAVHRAGRPESWPTGDQRGQQGVRSELLVDGGRVAVEVEQSSHALDGGLRVGEVVEDEGARDLTGRDRDRGNAVAVRQSQRAAVAVIADGLHSRNSARRQEAQQVLGLERLPAREADGQRAAGGRGCLR